MAWSIGIPTLRPYSKSRSTARGREAICEYLRAALGTGARYRIENEVLGKDRVAFHMACQYPDGTRVLTATTLEVRGGEIFREVSVEAWDE